jgi:hypothetical protein
MKLFQLLPDSSKIDRFICRLLCEWDGVLKRYEEGYVKHAKQTGKKTWDLPYVYNENAQVALLAIAAWEMGYFPFVNFNRTKRTKTGRGFQDLEILGPECRLWDFEAVFRECIEITSEAKAQTRIGAALDEAEYEARQIPRRDKRAGIAFLVPNKAKSEEDLCQFVTMVKGSLKRRDFGAIHFAPEKTWRESSHKDCPGVAIVGRWV